jgi:branched-chain amino acid transport system substrate-binding protein
VFASAGGNLVTAIGQANEFGLTAKQVVTAPSFYLSDVHAIGLERAQGLLLVQSWYWNLNDASRGWAKRFFERRKRMPNDIHAADYSATLHYLRGIAKAGTDEAGAVIAAMRTMPVNDIFTTSGVIRPDNKMVFNRYLMKIKTPQESKTAWDYLDVVAPIPAEQAFRSIAEAGCQFNKT